MDGQRGRHSAALPFQPLGDTVTYAPHRSATARAVPSRDHASEARALRWKIRIWIAGGVVMTLALIGFGVWAVVTADRRPATMGRHVPNGAVAGNFEFAVTSLRCGVSSVGPDDLQQLPGGQFCLLGVTVKNTGTEPELFDSGAQRVYDANGVAYAVADQAAVFLNDRSPTLLNEILPGDTVAGVLPFDVPTDAQLSEVSVHGSMSTPGVRMTLPPVQ
ncbi:DUF4352 domain-containing protein [Actinoplanes aureus]|jgi:hypothetical protein|uniref:DUF4352 domain-containing protein n=1 Tax=Actinoplanes aureus TaxID=2792083 RepID=A0A931C524_9ACTN|nr:DUF4352 domain-containing protein [Actinoplanes aureus]MBG0560752.1 DUF4352 domain-containing protein [Actinoplanes aureus]